jgi:hypothetical protein
MSNKARKNYTKQLRKRADEMPRPYSEGYFEEMENREFWDIDALGKANAPILKKIKYWEEEFQPSGNMGKWWASIQLQRLYKKLKHYK